MDSSFLTEVDYASSVIPPNASISGGKSMVTISHEKSRRVIDHLRLAKHLIAEMRAEKS